MSNVYLPILASFLSDISGIKQKQEKHKKEILEKWEQSANYPRKKKKAIRKRLNLEWSIANWDPFEF